MSAWRRDVSCLYASQRVICAELHEMVICLFVLGITELEPQ